MKQILSGQILLSYLYPKIQICHHNDEPRFLHGCDEPVEPPQQNVVPDQVTASTTGGERESSAGDRCIHRAS